LAHCVGALFMEERRQLENDVAGAAVEQWRQRVTACVTDPGMNLRHNDSN